LRLRRLAFDVAKDALAKSVAVAFNGTAVPIKYEREYNTIVIEFADTMLKAGGKMEVVIG
jgi:hypothetical protein